MQVCSIYYAPVQIHILRESIHTTNVYLYMLERFTLPNLCNDLYQV